jgi:hypothetical protein
MYKQAVSPIPFIYSKITQSSLTTCHGGVWRERMYGSYSFMTLALDGVGGERHARAACFFWENDPNTHCVGGWVGLRSGLDTGARGRILCLWSNPGRLDVHSVVNHYTDWATPDHPFICREFWILAYIIMSKMCRSRRELHAIGHCFIYIHRDANCSTN